MKIVCIGGGPAGLYFALLMKKLDSARTTSRVVERNKPYDTFGWGVVFSDATMDNMREWDRDTADTIEQSFAHWDDIELQFKGRTIRSGGHGFVGIGRKKLLNILQARCEAARREAGVRDRGRVGRRLPRRRPGDRQRRHQLAHPHAARRQSSSPTS